MKRPEVKAEAEFVIVEGVAEMKSANVKRASRWQATLITVATLFFTLAVPGHAAEDLKLFRTGGEVELKMEFDDKTTNPLIEKDTADFSKLGEFVKSFAGAGKNYEPALFMQGLRNALLASTDKETSKTLKDLFKDIDKSEFWKGKKEAVLSVVDKILELDKKALEDEDFLKNLIDSLEADELKELGITTEAKKESDDTAKVDPEKEAMRKQIAQLLEEKKRNQGTQKDILTIPGFDFAQLNSVGEALENSIDELQAFCEEGKAQNDALSDKIKDFERVVDQGIRAAAGQNPLLADNAVEDDNKGLLEELLAASGLLDNNNEDERDDAQLLAQQPQQQFPFQQQQPEENDDNSIGNPQFAPRQQPLPAQPTPFQLEEFEQAAAPQLPTVDSIIPETILDNQSEYENLVRSNTELLTNDPASTVTADIENRIMQASQFYGPQVGAGLARMELRGLFDKKAERQTRRDQANNALLRVSESVKNLERDYKSLKKNALPAEVRAKVEAQKQAFAKKLQDAKDRREEAMKQKQAEYQALGVDPSQAAAVIAQGKGQLDKDVKLAQQNLDNYEKYIQQVEASVSSNLSEVKDALEAQKSLEAKLQTNVEQLAKEVKTFDDAARRMESQGMASMFPQQQQGAGVINTMGMRPVSGGQVFRGATSSAAADQFRTNFGGQAQVSP